MKYKTTKEQRQKQIKDGFVCSQCGGKLSPIETVDNSGDPTFWSGCQPCYRFDYGVSVEIYKTAKILVEKRNYRHYQHIQENENDSKEKKLYKKQCQIGGACHMVVDVLNAYNEAKTLELLVEQRIILIM